jgi:eukaryotic-like serine/threonine-protein kinase
LTNMNPNDIFPREFGKYHLMERIASGGMAELFRAKLYGAGGFEKDLAIKKILPQLVQDSGFIQMFMDEAMITVTLNHGNIVSVMDFGEIDGEYYLVMEFIDGVDLQSLIRRSLEIFEPIPPSIACYICHEVCRGLDYAHRKVGPDGKPLEIIHRDVSPQNILISFEGEVKIVDFGIARAASRITSTQAGVLKGKVAYMSPEQIMGHDVDNRSDIFAAGIMLYEMLTNHRPFEGATPHETMAMITRGVFEKPQRLNNRVPKKLTAIINKSLEKNTKRRYHTAGEMAADLSDFLHIEGLRPDPSTLAAFIPQRLPEARPKTLPPTPIRTIRRDANRASAEPEHTPVPKAVSSQVFPAPSAPVTAPPVVSTPHVAAKNGEAVSFDMLGLPAYRAEPADSKLPTDQTIPTVSDPTPGVAPSTPTTRDPSAFELGPTQFSKEFLTATTKPMFKTTTSADPMAALSTTPTDPSELNSPEPHNILSVSALTPPTSPTPMLGSPVTLMPPPSAASAPTQAPPAADVADAWMDKQPAVPQTEPLAAKHSDDRPASKFKKGKMLGIAAGVIIVVGIGIVLIPGGQGTNQQNTTSSSATPKVTTPVVRPNVVENPATPPIQPTDNTPDKPAVPAATNPPVATSNTPPAPTPVTVNANNAGTDGKKPGNKASNKPLASPKTPLKPVAKIEPKKPVTTPTAGTGMLRINSEPFSIVFWNDKKLGPTPQMDVKLPIGSHTLTLKNDALGITKRVRVRIEADKVQTVFVDLNQK